MARAVSTRQCEEKTAKSESYSWHGLPSHHLNPNLAVQRRCTNCLPIRHSRRGPRSSAPFRELNKACSDESRGPGALFASFNASCCAQCTQRAMLQTKTREWAARRLLLAPLRQQLIAIKLTILVLSEHWKLQ